jgi:hypothetical protein
MASFSVEIHQAGEMVLAKRFIRQERWFWPGEVHQENQSKLVGSHQKTLVLFRVGS